MLDRDKSTHLWDGRTAFLFAVSVCFVYWALCIAGSFFADRTITISWPSLQFAIDIRLSLATGASLVPALFCFAFDPGSRASLKKFNASWTVYFVAFATGLSLPFSSYPGTHYFAFPWGREVALHLARV